MPVCGRLWAACLSAAASASTAVSFAAGPAPYGASDLRVPPRYAGATVSRQVPPRVASQGMEDRRPAVGSIQGFPSLAASRGARPVGRRGAVREYVRPATAGWVALVGEFSKPGSYEMAGDGISLAELLERSGGLTEQAAGTLRLVRNGRPVSVSSSSTTPLRAGDVLIADGSGDRRYGVSTVGHDVPGAGSERRIGVPIGIVGATERPLSLYVDDRQVRPTVGAIVAGLGQTHLKPQDVTVLVGGIRKVSGDQAGELTAGSVVLFAPNAVDQARVAASDIEVRAHYYPVQAPPSELPAEAVSQLPLQEQPPSQAAPEAMLASAPAFPAPADDSFMTAMPDTVERTAAVPPPPSVEGDLSELPSVEMLDPPADAPPLGFGRVADSSGAMPIGPPDVAEPHITAVPADSFYGSTEQQVAMADAAPMPPEPTESLGPARSSLGPADSVGLMATEEAVAEELSFGNLAATVLVGGVLGAMTFLILRKLRGRQLLARAIETVQARIKSRPEPALAERPTAVRTPAPSDLLAALVADRLAFREESIDLPATLRIFGRSTAMRKRRIDPAAAEVVPKPHIPIAVPSTSETVAVKEAVKKPAAAKMNLRIDPAEPRATEAPDLTAATPFERALAARQRESRRSRE